MTNDTRPTLDALAAALNSRAARYTLAALALVVTVAALAGAGAAVFDLQARHMTMPGIVAAFNAALVAVMPLALALGAAQAGRERTRAALVFWLAVWALVALSLAALDGVLSAAAVVADVQALTGVGRVLAPLPGALASVAVASILPTLRGDDDAGALGGLWSLAAKTVVVLFSSAGLFNVAAQAAGITERLYALALACVVEVSFIALLTRQNRTGAANALLYVLAVVLGLNGAESASVAFAFNLPAWLDWLPTAGRVSVVLSGAACVAAVVTLSVKRTSTTARPAVTDWLRARVADARALRGALPTRPAMTRPAAVALAAESTAAPEIDAPAMSENVTPARAEVQPRGRKSGQSGHPASRDTGRG